MLLRNPTGGALLGTRRQLTVTIEDNDYANGVVSFNSSSLYTEVQEPSSKQTISLVVVRGFGLFGAITVQWQALPALRDIEPSRGNVTLYEGVDTAIIVVSVLPDSDPEADTDVVIRLTSVSGGAELSWVNTTLDARIRVLSNDEPFGVFSFGSNRVIATGTEDEQLVLFNVTRSGGLLEAVTLFFRATEMTPMEYVRLPRTVLIGDTLTFFILTLFDAVQDGELTGSVYSTISNTSLL